MYILLHKLLQEPKNLFTREEIQTKFNPQRTHNNISNHNNFFITNLNMRPDKSNDTSLNYSNNLYNKNQDYSQNNSNNLIINKKKGVTFKNLFLKDDKE